MIIEARSQNDGRRPVRLLPGELSNTPYLGDANHWVQVYTELLSFSRDLIRQLDARVARHDGHVPEHPDRLLFSEQADRIEARLRFWKARQVALENAPGGPGEKEVTLPAG
jgi:hypothetical protein